MSWRTGLREFFFGPIPYRTAPDPPPGTVPTPAPPAAPASFSPCEHCGQPVKTMHMEDGSWPLKHSPDECTRNLVAAIAWRLSQHCNHCAANCEMEHKPWWTSAAKAEEASTDIGQRGHCDEHCPGDDCGSTHHYPRHRCDTCANIRIVQPGQHCSHCPPNCYATQGQRHYCRICVEANVRAQAEDHCEHCPPNCANRHAPGSAGYCMKCASKVMP